MLQFDQEHTRKYSYTERRLIAVSIIVFSITFGLFFFQNEFQVIRRFYFHSNETNVTIINR